MYENIIVTGHPVGLSVLRSKSIDFTTYIPLIIFIITILNYFLIGVLTKFTTNLDDETFKKLYRSLSLIAFVNIGSCLIFYTELLIIAGFDIENQNKMNVKTWFILTYSSIIYFIGSASNAPILFINSSDYREAYLKEFNLLNHFSKMIL
ncbi:hypothetical protein ACQ4LE_000752 [Meloidogyne hapla]